MGYFEAVTNMEFGAYNVYWGSALVRGKKGSRIGKWKNLNFKAVPMKSRPERNSKMSTAPQSCLCQAEMAGLLHPHPHLA